MKRIFCVLLILVMACGLLPAAAMAASDEHVHEPATDVWMQDDYGHWNPCYGIGSCEEKLNYAPHQTGEYSKMCSVCGRIPHICSSVNADCTYGSACDYCPYSAQLNSEKHRGRYAVSIDDNNHKIVCYCGHVYVESEPHQFNHWGSVEGKPDIEESWCEVAGCMHVATRKKEHTHVDGKCDTCNYGIGNSGNGGSTAESPVDTDPHVEDPDNSEKDEEGLGTGAIVAIVIGSVAIAGIGGFAIFWFVIKKKSWADLITVFKKN